MTCSAVSVSHFFSLYLSPIPKDSFAGNLNCAQVRELHNWDPVCLKNLHILRYLNCAALDVSAAPSLLGCVVVQVQYKSTKSTKSTHNNHQTRKIAENFAYCWRLLLGWECTWLQVNQMINPTDYMGRGLISLCTQFKHLDSRCCLTV